MCACRECRLPARTDATAVEARAIAPTDFRSDEVPDRVLEAYESVPYDSKPIHLSHVSRLETVARLYGLTPAPSDHCRVLELGCASGGNLLPMAANLPASRFVG